jgi:hypothetical protein
VPCSRNFRNSRGCDFQSRAESTGFQLVVVSIDSSKARVMGSGQWPSFRGPWPSWNLDTQVHLVASLLKRWLLGTHQGAVSFAYLEYYLDEFTFRFNRRTGTWELNSPTFPIKTLQACYRLWSPRGADLAVQRREETRQPTYQNKT